MKCLQPDPNDDLVATIDNNKLNLKTGLIYQSDKECQPKLNSKLKGELKPWIIGLGWD